MRKFLIVATLTLLSVTTFAQVKMRLVDELIDKSDPGWPLVKQWIDSAKNGVEILSNDTTNAKDALYKIQLSTHSPMGSIVYMTGGLLIDNGWIRILGSGNPKLTRTLPDWNRDRTFSDFGEQTPFLLVADDAIGGFFLLNDGEFGSDLGKIYYFSPKSLKFEPLNLTYTDFLKFCFNADLDNFYKGLRWTNWKRDVSGLHGDDAISFSPHLWSKNGRNVNKDIKKVVSVSEQYFLNLEYRIKLGLDN